ncbi:RNA-binding domain-containing protein [Epithele typhae]|uniref:RNA-binding domain-containing protein n=1 Tax=Epithele typhae TaxID=378194 RepID=UPI002007EA6B|nr:RNA-binding domain-containing protein [Epithele typhae]KAH9921537.1 RNA-binding domain-containing protein [Epithele typhae]
MYADSAIPADPYNEAYNNDPPPASAAPPSESRDLTSLLPAAGRARVAQRVRTNLAKQAPNPSNVLGVFGLSIRSTERDLDDEFSRFGRVEKVVIVYDQRSDRSRGFGFITMSTVDEAARCIKELNGVELNGRRIRVDYSVTDRPHAPTPGEYMGHRRREPEVGSRDYVPRDRHDDRNRRDREPYRGRYDRDDRDRDHYGRDSRDWRDRRSPPPRSRYSPEYRRRRSYSRSPPRGSSPGRGRDYDAPAATNGNSDSRW